MIDDLDEDQGAPPLILRVVAWVLGLLAVGALIRVVSDLGDAGDLPVDTELLVWGVVSVVAAVFSTCCAVLCGLKNAERRLRSHSVAPQSAD